MNTPETKPRRLTLSIATRPGIDTYHYVWAEGRRAPRQRHATLAAAVAEAERLATINPGTTYHVYIGRRITTRRTAGKVTP